MAENKLELNSHVCHQIEGDNLVFGKVTQEAGPHQSSPVIQWDEEVENANPIVYDKSFQEGQRVCRISDGMIGQITKVNCLATAFIQFDEQTFVLPDISLDRLKPISPLYPGVNVMHNGWIGRVEHVRQSWRLQFQDYAKTTCKKVMPVFSVPVQEQETSSVKYSSLVPLGLREESLSPCTYPYFQGRRIGLAGQQSKFSFKELRYANWKGFTSWKRPPFVLAWHFHRRLPTILSTQDAFVKVHWEQQYDGAQVATEKPPATFDKLQATHLQPRFIFPHEYIANKTWAKLEWLEADSEQALPVNDWKEAFVASITGKDEEIPLKRLKLEHNFPLPGALLPVTVHILRHELEVDWEYRNSSKIMACDVQTPKNLPHAPILQEQKYVVAKQCLYRPDDAEMLGINQGTNGENMMEVAWTHTQAQNENPDDCNQVPAVKTRESVFDLDYKIQLCGFREGHFVVPSEACRNPNFKIGVVEKFGFDGKIIIRDGNTKPAFRLWPWEIRNIAARPEELPPANLSSFTEIAKGLKDGEGTLSAFSFATRDLMPNAPETHFFYGQTAQLGLTDIEFRKLRLQVFCDYMRLHDLLPKGVWIRGYDDRYDLHSVLIIGPPNTPFERFIFTFDVYLPVQYPHVLPFIRMNSPSQTPMSPFITNGGFVDIYKLNPPALPLDNSKRTYSLDSVISALYERIFNAHPLRTLATILDAGDMNMAKETARQNQSVCIVSLDTCIQTLSNPPEPWKQRILGHYMENLPIIGKKVSRWNSHGAQFSLLPTTEGFTISIIRRLEIIRQIMKIAKAKSNRER